MRTDLNKQLCERERHGHRYGFKNVRRRKSFASFGEDGENLRPREGMRLRYVVAGDTKEFSENLSPLWGQVRKAVGQRWDRFYSELCLHFDMRSRINQHILQHLKGFCEREDIVLKDGELYLRGRGRWSDDIPLRGSWVEYYVDPRDGIIKRNKHFKTVQQLNRERATRTIEERNKVERWVDADHVLRLIDGVWFLFTLEDVPLGHTVIDKPASPELFEVRRGRLRRWEQLDEYDRRRFGEKRYFGRTVVDLFTGEALRCDASKPLKHQRRRYHAVKRTASHKLLKQVGLA
jgi:hypothetical protein